MSSKKIICLERVLSSLPGRTTLVILTVMVIAPSLSLVYLLNLYGGFTQVTFLVQAGVGISSGLVARWLLGRKSRGLQLSAAMAALIAGQSVLGFISKGVLGMTFLVDVSIGRSNWSQLLQTFWSATVASLIILAWNGNRQHRQDASKVPDDKGNSDIERNLTENNFQERQKLIPRMKIFLTNIIKGNTLKISHLSNQRNHVEGEDTRSRHNQQQVKTNSTRDKENQQLLKVFPTPHFPNITWINSADLWMKSQDKAKKIWTRFKKIKEDVSALLITTQKNPVNVKNNKIRFTKINIVNSGLWKFSQNRTPSKVKLVGREEHICPYCLEQVTPQDRRGLKKCPICKTWHHADCWSEAGECQVPHYQN